MSNISTIINNLSSAKTPEEYNARLAELRSAFATLDAAGKASPEAAQAATILVAVPPAGLTTTAVVPSAPKAQIRFEGQTLTLGGPALLRDKKGNPVLAFRSEEEARRYAAKIINMQRGVYAGGDEIAEELAYLAAVDEADAVIAAARSRGAVVLPEAESRPWWHYALAAAGVAAVAVAGVYAYNAYNKAA